MLGIILLLIGFAFLLLAGLSGRRRLGVRQWPSSQGRILSASLCECLHGEDGDAYWPNVTYEYVVENRRYAGDRIALGETEMGLAEAQRTIERFSPGAFVRVYYDPAHPTMAVLERHVGWQDVSLFGAIGLSCVGGAILVGIAA